MNVTNLLQLYVKNLRIFVSAVKVFFLLHLILILYINLVSPIKIFGKAYESIVGYILPSMYVFAPFVMAEITLKLFVLVLLFTIVTSFIIIFRYDLNDEIKFATAFSEALGRTPHITAFTIMFLIISGVLGALLGYPVETFSQASALTILFLFLIIFIVLPPVALGTDLVTTLRNLKDTISRNKASILTNFIISLALIVILWNVSQALETVTINMSSSGLSPLKGKIGASDLDENERGLYAMLVRLVPELLGKLVELCIILGAAIPLSAGFAALPWLPTVRLEYELNILQKENEEIKSLVDMAKLKYHKRKLDEESLRELTRGYQKRLIEVETRIEEINENLGKLKPN